MGSLPFPSLSLDKHVDHGLWCKGCQLVCRQWTSNDPTMEYMSHFFLRGRQVINVIYHYEEFPRSKAEFLAHIEECAGVKKLLQ
jgi:hypothetical protein